MGRTKGLLTGWLLSYHYKCPYIAPSSVLSFDSPGRSYAVKHRVQPAYQIVFPFLKHVQEMRRNNLVNKFLQGLWHCPQ